MHEHTAACERERYPARADPELERASPSGELDEQVDDRVDDRRVEHLPVGIVVPCGYALVEVAVVVHPAEPTAPSPSARSASQWDEGEGLELAFATSASDR